MIAYKLKIAFSKFDFCHPSGALWPVWFCRKGSFKNFVDIISFFFNHPPTSTVTLYGSNMDKNIKFLTTNPPPVVHMVFEWPLMYEFYATTELDLD